MSIWTALFICGLFVLVCCLCVVYLAGHDTQNRNYEYDYGGTNLFWEKGNED